VFLFWAVVKEILGDSSLLARWTEVGMIVPIVKMRSLRLRDYQLI
jgi:hypothetical protein